jgi:ParB-like chromosome segregation protein Spo0J
MEAGVSSIISYTLKITMMVRHLPIAQLRPDPRNPRKHGLSQVKAIARSIRELGFNVPVLIDAENRVVAGHARVEAARRLGMTEVPAIRLDHLTPEQARVFNIADNRLAEHSSWDETLLGEVFSELSTADL